MDAFATKEVKQQDRDDRGAGRQQGTTKRFVNALVDHASRQIGALTLSLHEFGRTQRLYRSASNR